MTTISINAPSVVETMKALAAVERQFRGVSRAANLDVARRFEGWARSDAASFSRQTRHFAHALKGSASSQYARLTIDGRRVPGAWGAFYGAKRYRQFPGWVGSSWPYASRTQGPYSVNATLAAHIDDIGGMILSSRARAMHEVFPIGGVTSFGRF